MIIFCSPSEFAYYVMLIFHTNNFLPLRSNFKSFSALQLVATFVLTCFRIMVGHVALFWPKANCYMFLCFMVFRQSLPFYFIYSLHRYFNFQISCFFFLCYILFDDKRMFIYKHLNIFNSILPSCTYYSSKWQAFLPPHLSSKLE